MKTNDIDLKVGILTTFYAWDEAYSLTGVVKHQLLSLIQEGYSPVLFVLEGFSEKESFKLPIGVEVRRVIPQIITEPYGGVKESNNIPQQFEKDVAKLVPVFNEQFKDIDIMLCHDIIFQESFLAYNAALRKMVMNKGQKFLHWMHSGPSIRPANLTEPVSFLYTMPPQSVPIYMNSYDIVAIAEMYGLYPKDIRIVHNPIDYTTMPNIHPIVHQIITDYKLHDADVISVYPLSTTRMGNGGKQIHKAIKVLGFLKKELGWNVKFIIPNAHANGDNEKAEIQKVLEFGEQYGLEPMEDLIFTSFVNSTYESGIPHDAVLQLFQLSDVFIFPSYSENCPLILLEAALTKNLLVLNEDFSPMKEFVGSNALYFKFDSVRTTSTHPRGEDTYYRDIAKIIAAELISNRIYTCHKEIRNKFSMNYIFKNQLEPIFYEQESDLPIEGELVHEETSKTNVPEDMKSQIEDDINKLKEKYGID